MLFLIIAAFVATASSTNLAVNYLDIVDQLDIMEKGTRVTERVVTNEDGIQEIVIPKHNQLTGMSIYNDFNNDVSVYKMHSEQRCYVMDLTADMKKSFLELHEAIQNHTKEVANPSTPFTGLKYADYVLKPENLLARDDVDVTSPGGELAVRKCGVYKIVSGIAIPTSVDVNTFALETLKKSVANSPNYDLPIRDLFTCNDALKNYALAEMQRCGGVMNDFRAICKFRKSSCAYIVSCPYAQKYHYWLCKGKHNFTNMFCCEYECTRPRQ